MAKKKKVEFGPRDHDGDLDTDWKKWAWSVHRDYWQQFKPKAQLFELSSYSFEHRAKVETLWTPPKVMSMFALHTENMECLLETKEDGSLWVKGRFVSGPTFIKHEKVFHDFTEPEDWFRVMRFYKDFIEEKMARKLEVKERGRPGVYMADKRAGIAK